VTDRQTDSQTDDSVTHKLYRYYGRPKTTITLVQVKLRVYGFRQVTSGSALAEY